MMPAGAGAPPRAGLDGEGELVLGAGLPGRPRPRRRASLRARAPAAASTPRSALPDFRATPEGRAMIRDYCVDPAFLAGLDRLRRRGAATPEQRIGYILTTGGNWRSPIGDFRLVVDKGAPANLVSFCGEGVRKISPTRFEMVGRTGGRTGTSRC